MPLDRCIFSPGRTCRNDQMGWCIGRSSLRSMFAATAPAWNSSCTRERPLLRTATRAAAVTVRVTPSACQLHLQVCVLCFNCRAAAAVVPQALAARVHVQKRHDPRGPQVLSGAALSRRCRQQRAWPPNARKRWQGRLHWHVAVNSGWIVLQPICAGLAVVRQLRDGLGAGGQGTPLRRRRVCCGQRGCSKTTTRRARSFPT